jgi:predicted MPP superfamily phosphohydrolase
MLRQLRPDIVFIAGDLYDGTKVEPKHLAAPWMNVSPPLGKFYVTGNHEEFSHPSQYIQALQQCGVRALVNEKTVVDDLQLVGVTYSTLTNPERLQSILCSAALQPNTASILLAHAPHQLSVSEKMGVSLQLSGHTHNGQVFPFTWITSRIFRQYTYGLNRHGALTVYTSSGAGTWGPPMRVGSRPEIVLIRFE